MRVAERVAREKPVLVVKGGGVEDAHRGARTRTAAELRGDAVFDAVLHQGGVMRFRSGEELFQAAELFESQPLPRGRQIGIVTNSPSVATLAAEACATRGLHVSVASEAQNPSLLALGAGPPEYATAVGELVGDDGIDALLVAYVDRQGGDAEAILEAITAASKRGSKPVVASVVRFDGRLPAQTGRGVPNFLFPESCAAALARAAERHAWLSRPLANTRLPRPGPSCSARADHLIARARAGRRLAVTRRGGSAARHPRNPVRRLAPLPRRRYGGGGGA